jgi:predicted DNA-binding transcriptional regulator AlpA
MSINESRLLKLESVLEIVPVSKATWYRIVENKKELKPLKIGRGSFWRESQIKQFVDSLENEEK